MTVLWGNLQTASASFLFPILALEPSLRQQDSHHAALQRKNTKQSACALVCRLLESHHSTASPGWSL